MDENKDIVPPPPGLGFDDDVESGKKEPGGTPVATVLKTGDGGKNLSKYQLKRIESKIPDNMALYEQNSYVQLFLVSVTAAIAILNLNYNFQMIELYEEQEAQFQEFRAMTPPSEANQTLLISGFKNATADGSLFCDVEYFASAEFDAGTFLEDLGLITAIAKASTYLAVGLFVPMHIIFKGISAFYLITSDFENGLADLQNAKGTQQAMMKSMGATGGGEGTPIKPQPVAMTRAAKNSMILENEDEKTVRIFLRGETILFAWVQGFQDIPQGTLAILYIVIQRSIRGLYCYGTFVEGRLSPNLPYDQINSTVYIQLGMIALSAIWNIMILGARWIQFFHYRTIKFQKKPRSFCYRLIIAFGWGVMYCFGIATPVFALTYSSIGQDIIGFDNSAIGVFYILTIVGAICASIGFLLICCWWGTNFSEGLCVGCVVWEAFCVAFTACEFEWCEFCDACCC